MAPSPAVNIRNLRCFAVTPAPRPRMPANGGGAKRKLYDASLLRVPWLRSILHTHRHAREGRCAVANREKKCPLTTHAMPTWALRRTITIGPPPCSGSVQIVDSTASATVRERCLRRSPCSSRMGQRYARPSRVVRRPRGAWGWIRPITEVQRAPGARPTHCLRPDSDLLLNHTICRRTIADRDLCAIHERSGL